MPRRGLERIPARREHTRGDRQRQRVVFPDREAAVRRLRVGVAQLKWLGERPAAVRRPPIPTAVIPPVLEDRRRGDVAPHSKPGVECRREPDMLAGCVCLVCHIMLEVAVEPVHPPPDEVRRRDAGVVDRPEEHPRVAVNPLGPAKHLADLRRRVLPDEREDRVALDCVRRDTGVEERSRLVGPAPPGDDLVTVARDPGLIQRGDNRLDIVAVRAPVLPESLVALLDHSLEPMSRVRARGRGQAPRRGRCPQSRGPVLPSSVNIQQSEAALI